MNTIASPATTRADAGMPPRRVLGAYLAEIRSECLRYLRMPGFMLPTILFPSVFYVMFGVAMTPKTGSGGFDIARYMLASYSTFGVMAPGLFGFGVALALERDNGLLTLKRALPMPPAAYLLAKMAMAMLVSSIIALVMIGLAILLVGVALTPLQMLALFVTAVLGVLPFCALGLLIGTFIKGQGAPAVVNLVYLPLAFLSGLWIPLKMLPHVLQQIAPLWPSYHLNQVTLNAVGIQSTALLPHVLVLAAYTLGFLGLGARRLRRNG